MGKRKFTGTNMMQCIIATAIILLFTGCSDFFTDEDYSLSDIQTYEQLEQAMGGIVDLFRDYSSKNSFYASCYMGDDLLTFKYSIGSVSFSSSDYYESFREKAKCKRALECFLMEIEDWDKFYLLIGSVNNVLTQFDVNDKHDAQTRILLGELYFYRAYFYYRLTRIYGRIPLIDDIDVDYTVKRASFNEIYEFIEADLLQSMQLLPVNIDESRIPYETPNRGMAKAMLGEVYLSWAGYPANEETKYALAARVTGEVIDSASYFGFGLLPDFEDLWNSKSFYNKEAVFCNYYPHKKKFNTHFYLYVARLYSYSQQLWSPGFGIDPNTIISISENQMPEIEFYNRFPKGYRKDITFFTRIYVHPVEYLPELDTGYIDVEKVDCESRAAYRKFLLDTMLIPQEGDFDSHFNKERAEILGCQRIYILRFAQTLLTYAEASARSGRLDEKAYNCLNMIRRRANNLPLDVPSDVDIKPGLSIDAFADSVVQERAWEFAGEQGYRWFDMVRTQTVEQVYEKRDPKEGGKFIPSENDQYFFPIPESDINLNYNLAD